MGGEAGTRPYCRSWRWWYSMNIMETEHGTDDQGSIYALP